jgi:hypothetical protein
LADSLVAPLQAEAGRDSVAPVMVPLVLLQVEVAVRLMAAAQSSLPGMVPKSMVLVVVPPLAQLLTMFTV